VKNEKSRKCRIVAGFLSKTSIREFFKVFRRIAQLRPKKKAGIDAGN
jgi:hypothetical protein